MKTWTIRGAIFVAVLIGLAVARIVWGPARIDTWVIVLCMLATVAAVYPDLLKFIGGKIRKLSGPWGELDLSGDPKIEEDMKNLLAQIPDPSKLLSSEGIQRSEGLRTEHIFLVDDDGNHRGFVGSIGEATLMTFGAKDAPCLSFVSRPDGTGSVTLFDASGNLRVGIIASDKGASLMLGKDKIRAGIFTYDNAEPSVNLYDKSGAIRRSLTIPPSAVDAVTKTRRGKTLLGRPVETDSDEVNQ